MPIHRYSFSQRFIDPERCFVSINELENLGRTDRQRTENRQTDRQKIQLQRQLLSPVDRQGEQANINNKL